MKACFVDSTRGDDPCGIAVAMGLVDGNGNGNLAVGALRRRRVMRHGIGGVKVLLLLDPLGPDGLSSSTSPRLLTVKS